MRMQEKRERKREELRNQIFIHLFLGAWLWRQCNAPPKAWGQTLLVAHAGDHTAALGFGRGDKRVRAALNAQSH
jgi:hypothetical protein